jgi:hypothetical protein
MGQYCAQYRNPGSVVVMCRINRQSKIRTSIIGCTLPLLNLRSRNATESALRIFPTDETEGLTTDPVVVISYSEQCEIAIDPLPGDDLHRFPVALSTQWRTGATGFCGCLCATCCAATDESGGRSLPCQTGAPHQVRQL